MRACYPGLGGIREGRTHSIRDLGCTVQDCKNCMESNCYSGFIAMYCQVQYLGSENVFY